MRLFCILFLFALGFSTIYSQENDFQIDSHHLQTGIDSTESNYLIFTSNEYYRKDFYSRQWINVKYKQNELPKSSDFPYQFFHIKEKNYLVHNGCGTVYEFRNDSIVRIDNSFEHKSQFGASSFVYDDEIYFFGGYGLFTFKNILTKFDFNTKEWELVKYSNSGIPQPRDKMISFLKGDAFYVISGYTAKSNGEQLTENSKQIFDSWKLNLKSKTWEFLGELNNKDYFKTLKMGSCYSAEDKFYADYNRLLNIDIINGALNLHKPKNKFVISFGEKYNQKTKEIIYALPHTNDSNKSVNIIVEPFSEYRGNIVESKPLFKSKLKFLFHGFIGFVVLIGILLLSRMIAIKSNNRITLISGKFYHKRKPITNLTLDEETMLEFFYKHKEKHVLVSELIDVISDEDCANYNTLSKKKDLVFNSLKQKLCFMLETDENELFLYSKNDKDKRIKQIRLNEKYLG